MPEDLITELELYNYCKTLGVSYNVARQETYDDILTANMITSYYNEAERREYKRIERENQAIKNMDNVK